MTTILGIDPGATGAIAMICPMVEVWPMPDTPHDLSALLRTFDAATTRVYVEAVHSMPGQGVASTFKFGMVYGQILGILAAYDLRHTLVTPAKWKGALGLTGKPKSASKVLAQQLFGKVASSEGKSEALLIAHWGRRVLGGTK